jgi:hypothetical protein
VELSGENFSWTTNASAKARKRGRPTRLDDASLVNRRDSLVGVLESAWGLVGWELQTAATVEDVRRALLPIADWRHELSPFVRNSAAPSDARLRVRQRKDVAAAGEALRKAYESEQGMREAEQRAAMALHQLRASLQTLKHGDSPAVPSQVELLAGQIASLELEHGRRKRELDTAIAAYIAARQQDSCARERLLDYEAYFAQSELLRFVQSGRYRLIPLSFANAMAGLPFKGWRQSFKGCTRHKCRIVNSLAYQQFLSVQMALSQARRAKGPITEQIRAYLKHPRRQRQPAVIQLKNDWYCLSEAITRVEAEDTEPGRLPYKILAEYSRRMQVRSALDLLREEEERLR